MSPEQRLEIVAYRLNSAKSLLAEIQDHIAHGYYNTAVNRMYYACFYAVNALLVHAGIEGVKTHDGARQMFGQHFIKTGILPKAWGRFYSLIFNCRSAADYEDFKNYDKPEALELYQQVCEFINLIDEQIFLKS